MLKHNSVSVHSNMTTAHSAKVRTGWPHILGDFGNFFNCSAKSPHVLLLIILNIERVHFVLQNCEILHSVRGLYDENGIKGWFTSTQICWRDFVR